MTTSEIPALSLNDGSTMPQLGLGTYKLQGDDAHRIVREGIALGYRHIDTASFYDNEEAVGAAIAEAIAAGDVTRDELFISTKLWNDQQGAGNTQRAFRESLAKLQLDYLDLYLIHWPWAQRGLFCETFETMAELQRAGGIRSLGVCNFYEETLDELISTTGITPVLNQVEMHVGFSQAPLHRYHGEHGIVSEAWAPLARGVVLDDPVVTEIARRHDATPAQVVLGFLMAQGVSVIPKTASSQRLAENLAATRVELGEDDVAALAGLDAHGDYGRLSNDPRVFPGEVE
ncbi:aldo/keto reductase [Corynebacterium uterequi]|nr:aldo/keto reductase [Corynebacterium uterequi]